MTDSLLKAEARVTLKLFIPMDAVALDLKGKVNWVAPNLEWSFKYQGGIQFAPYGEKKGENSLEVLKRLKVLEEIFLDVKGTQGRQ